VINGDGKAETRSVKPGERQNSLWVIEDGLRPGEHVVVEGAQKVRDGQTVKAMPWKAPAATRTD